MEHDTAVKKTASQDKLESLKALVSENIAYIYDFLEGAEEGAKNVLTLEDLVGQKRKLELIVNLKKVHGHSQKLLNTADIKRCRNTGK